MVFNATFDNIEVMPWR